MTILSYNPVDKEYFVGLSSSEFEEIEKKYVIENMTDLRYEITHPEYAELVRNAYGIDTIPFVYIVVKQDISSIVSQSATFPFDPLWNGYSPWEKIEVKEIDSLKDLCK